MNSLLSFIIVLGVLIFVHEFGHFLFAKLFGVRVLTFSLGFGRKVIGRQWGETFYQLSAFPLGGYVKMYGEQVGDEVSEADKSVSFSHKKTWQRFGIVLAGPLFNLLFAVFIFWGMFMFLEMPQPVAPIISEVQEASAAERSGLQAGDTLVSINGFKIKSWLQIATLVNSSKGRPLVIIVRRDGKELEIKATPELKSIEGPAGKKKQRYLLGISNTAELKFEKKPLFAALQAAFLETWGLIYMTFNGIVMMFKGLIPASELGGPIRIAEIAGKQMEMGWLNLINFTALLSVNLGILNLLPIPVLDGGHLVFLTVEAIRRKPLNDESLLWAQKIGIALLGSLMIFVFYNDIAGLVKEYDLIGIIQKWLAAT